MQTVWIVTLLVGNEFEISGVYSTADLAMAACKTDMHGTIPMMVDRDYSDETEFMVHSRTHPAGIMTTNKK